MPTPTAIRAIATSWVRSPLRPGNAEHISEDRNGVRAHQDNAHLKYTDALQCLQDPPGGAMGRRRPPLRNIATRR